MKIKNVHYHGIEELYEVLVYMTGDEYLKFEKQSHSPSPDVVGDSQIDERRYKSIVSDIIQDWRGGSDQEYNAMWWLSQKIYEKFLIKVK